jgi:putative transposase
MITILSTLVSLLSFRVRSRASLELELIALRHQVIFLRRQRPRRLRLFFTDRLFWVYRDNTVLTVVYGMVGFWVSAR